WAVGLTPGRRRISDLTPATATQALTGAAVVSLPLFFPTETQPLGGAGANTWRAAVGNLAQMPGSVTVTGPNLPAVFAGPALLNTQTGMAQGVDRMMQTLHDSLNRRVARGLPVVGDNLANALRDASFLSAFHRWLVDEITRAYTGRTMEIATLIQQFVFGL